MKLAAQFFRVLGDEARLQILWLLFNHRELCVCDVMAVVGITQSKVSRHLGVMRHAGLVTDRKDGLWSYYSLSPVEDDLAREHIELLRKSIARRPDAAALIQRLEAWMNAKHQGAACSKEGAGAFMKKNTATSRAKRTRSH